MYIYNGNYENWHGFRKGENDITWTKINKWSHKDYEIGIEQVVELAKFNGFEIIRYSNAYLRTVFNSAKDINKFYKLVMSI